MQIDISFCETFKPTNRVSEQPPMGVSRRTTTPGPRHHGRPMSLPRLPDVHTWKMGPREGIMAKVQFAVLFGEHSPEPWRRNDQTADPKEIPDRPVAALL